MKKLANVAAYLFILAVVVLSAISIFGVWEFFSDDVVAKSFSSVGILALVTIIVMVADHFIDRKDGDLALGENGQQVLNTDVFKTLRSITAYVLIIAVVLLAFFGILAIWEVLSSQVLSKSLISIGIIAFSSLVIILTCLEREKNPIIKKYPVIGVIVVIIIVYYFISVLSAFL